MAGTEPITGAEFFARSLAANGTTHVFFIDAVLRRTLIELGTLGVTRVLGHSEKAVAYMADGYARIAGRPCVSRNRSARLTSLRDCRTRISPTHRSSRSPDASSPQCNIATRIRR